MFQSKDFEKALQDNLVLFTNPCPVSGKDFFQATREISLARFALSQQANAYSLAIDILQSFLEQNASDFSQSPDKVKLLTNIHQCINSIEQKSISLISSAKEVIALLGTAVNIDINKAELSTLVIQLPLLVKETINKLSQDPELADRISSSLDSRISELLLSLRHSGVIDQAGQSSNPSSGPGITFDDYSKLYDSVPSQPQVS